VEEETAGDVTCVKEAVRDCVPKVFLMDVMCVKESVRDVACVEEEAAREAAGDVTGVVHCVEVMTGDT
jgi:hypothetical protein